MPGLGTVLSLELRDAIHAIRRFPIGQDCASYARLGKCRQESAGTRDGTAVQTIGNAHLTWAFAEAAVLCLRTTAPGQKLLARLGNKPDKGKSSEPPGASTRPSGLL